MNDLEKTNLYNETLNKIKELLLETDKQLGQMQSLSILSSIVKDYDLETASNLIKNDCEPCLTKLIFEDGFFSEGNDDAGFIPLKTVLNTVEEVINCDDSNYYGCCDVHFRYFVRPETEEEMEEEGHSNSVEWYTVDENIDIEKLNLLFEVQ